MKQTVVSESESNVAKTRQFLRLGVECVDKTKGEINWRGRDVMAVLAWRRHIATAEEVFHMVIPFCFLSFRVTIHIDRLFTVYSIFYKVSCH